MILQSVYTYLKSLGICDAIYPEFLPQKHTFPAITIELDSDLDIQLLDGSQSELHEALITLNIYDPSLLVASAMADTVKSALIGYTGAFGSNQAQYIYKEFESSAPETATGLRGISVQLNIKYY